MREQIIAQWASKEKKEYLYTVVMIDGKVVRVFNSAMFTIQPGSEVFGYFQRTLNK